MLRYRTAYVFAVVFVLVFVHFSRSREWKRVLLDRHPTSPELREGLGVDSPRERLRQVGRPPPPADYVPPGQDAKEKGRVGNEKTEGNDDSDEKDASKIDEKERGRTPGKGYRPQDVNLFPQADYRRPTHWKKTPVQYPLAREDMIALPTGRPTQIPKLQASVFKRESATEKQQRDQKLALIRENFEHAWTGYKASAMGRDELLPLRGGGKDGFNGWGATLVDALDTLWILGLHEEFAIAVDQVQQIDFTTSARPDIPLFETVIRYLGGLLGAYDVSNHTYPVLLDKAKDLAEILLGAFDTPNHMPTLYYLWAPEFASTTHRSSRQAVLAEIGSLTVEFTRLAQLTGDNRYYDAVARISNELNATQMSTRLPGLWPTRLDATGCEGEQINERDLESDENVDGEASLDEQRPGPEKKPQKPRHCAIKSKSLLKETFGMGGGADSTYEYLPKEYMLLGGSNDQYKTMYQNAMVALREHLLFRPMVKHGRDLRFLATVDAKKTTSATNPNKLTRKYEGSHLTCFAGGMVAMGAKLFGLKNDMDLATKLTDSCVWAYDATYTGIMPESFLMLPCRDDQCLWDEDRYKNALDPHRPERLAEEKARAESKKAKTTPAHSPTPMPFVRNRNGIVHSARPVNTIRPDDIRPVEIRLDNLRPRDSPDNDNQDTQGSKDSKEGKEEAKDDHFITSDEYIKIRMQEERLPPGMTRLTDRKYLLRPEAIESVFVMYRLTGDDHWRQKGWRMFESISKYTRTLVAHSSINDVTSMEPGFTDSMESFWLAETLKYFYLLFSDPDVVSLDDFVL